MNRLDGTTEATTKPQSARSIRKFFLDPQLEKAVEAALDLLAKNPPPKHKSPSIRTVRKNGSEHINAVKDFGPGFTPQNLFRVQTFLL